MKNDPKPQIEDIQRITSAEQLAELLRKSRKSQKITIEKLAQFADLSRDAILKFENNKTDIRISNLLKLLSLCNIELLIRLRKK
jgi:transcriptional regulator with XRE-family HTH domain